MATSSATTAFAGGSVVAAGVGGLVGSGGTAMGTGASSMMGLGFEQVSQRFSYEQIAIHGIQRMFCVIRWYSLPRHGGFMPEVDKAPD